MPEQKEEEDMKREQQTLEYYSVNAESFVTGSLAADLSATRDRFAACLPAGSYILDFGCGSGRDTKAFLDAGFRVDAADGSPEMCARASAYTGIRVRNMLFGELDEHDKYDGIWACASILHLPEDELADVIHRIRTALKTGGVLYTSFKYGEGARERDGRFFTDFTEKTILPFWESAASMRMIDMWITNDARPGREHEQWLNLLARKE